MSKKKRTTNSDGVRSRKQEKSEKKLNPFEVKVNRQKHEVLGRKVTKHERGMPGVSRSKAIKRRKETLLKEYEQQHKVNKVVDKRFGENDSSLTHDDKMMKRYAIERAKSGMKNKYNLNEDDELTHYGQSLAEIEKFDDPKNSDDDNDDDDDDRRAAAKFVAEQHFGGFMTKKVETESETSKTWKERMGEMILQSKKAKHDRQVEKEETEKMTEDVDAAWKDLRDLVKPNTKNKTQEETKPAADDYDIAVRSLKFDIRAKATDRLKSEEELAKEEKERLDKLEDDRIRRMKGISEDSKQPKFQHKSADDLDDGFQIEDNDFEYVSYKDGKLLREETKDNEEDNGEESDDDDDEDGDSGSGEDNNDDDEDNNDEDGDEDNDDVDDDSDGADSYDDLLSDLEEEEAQAEVKQRSKVKQGSKEINVTKPKGEKAKDESKVDSKLTKEEMEKAKKEIPYTFAAPVSYDDLLEVLQGHDLEGQLTIIDRIRKCHHPSLAEENKDKLEALFGYLVQLYGDLCLQDPPQLDFVERLLPALFEMTQMFPEQSAQTIITEIADRQTEFREICDRKAGRGLYPALDTVMLFKLVSILFPTSDFYHHVTTPTMLFMCQILSQCPVQHGRDVVTGLLLCNLCLEFVSMSKRLVPEAINFLHGILFLSCNKEPNKYESVVPPFKPVGKAINLLHVSSPHKKEVSSQWSISKMLCPEVEDDTYDSKEFRVEAVQRCIKLLEEFSLLYRHMSAYKTLFSPVLHLAKKLPVKHYPKTLKTRVQGFVSQCDECCQKPLPVLVMQKAKPKPLALVEPLIEDSFDGRKRYKHGSKEQNEKHKLMHKYKKEMKGARRELKKDTQFIARQRLSAQMAKDSERKRKVRELMGSLANQEGEFKKMKLGKAEAFF